MKKHTFSLIELLVVIGVIVILVGIAFPTYALVKKKAMIAKTTAAIVQLEGAITNYESTYQILPFTQTSTVDLLLNTTQYETLLDSLGGSNPRGIKMLPMETPKTYKDAWGNDFNVALDLDYSNTMDASVVHGYTGASDLTKSYAIWSMGPDGLQDAADDAAAVNEDNVNSWSKK